MRNAANGNAVDWIESPAAQEIFEFNFEVVQRAETELGFVLCCLDKFVDWMVDYKKCKTNAPGGPTNGTRKERYIKVP